MKLIHSRFLALALYLCATALSFGQAMDVVMIYVNTGHASEDSDSFNSLFAVAQELKSHSGYLTTTYTVIAVDSWAEAKTYKDNNPSKYVDVSGHGLYTDSPTGGKVFTGKVAEAASVVGNDNYTYAPLASTITGWFDPAKLNFCGRVNGNTISVADIGNDLAVATYSGAIFGSSFDIKFDSTDISNDYGGQCPEGTYQVSMDGCCPFGYVYDGNDLCIME